VSEAKPLPLQGIKVIELGTLIAGPFCARLLAEFGAEVIKIEQPGSGDPLRKWRKLHQGTSLWWYAQARNKKSVTLDLKQLEAQDIVRKLTKGADIVVENFRPGAMEKWGLGWEQLSKLNPGLIMVRLSGFGQTGPYRDRAGFGAIGESMGGLRYITGYPDRPPVRVGVSIGDSIAALHGVIGALMALHHRNVNGGRGQYVDVALYEAVFNMMESVLPEYDMFGFVRERSGASLPGIVPSNTYVTRDNRYVVIGANADSIFKRMMNGIGRPDLATDPALAHNDGRVARTGEIEKVIGDWVAAHDLEHVLDVLEKADVPSGKIYDIADIAKDAHYAAREMIRSHRLKDGKSVKLPGIVPKLSETPGDTKWVGPALGEHTAEVLGALGYSKEQQQDLKRRGVI
jgi:formyl-CoA transferase